MSDIEKTRLELAAAAISLFLFLSSEVLSMSNCNANGIGDLLGQALRALHGQYATTSTSMTPGATGAATETMATV